MFTKVLKVQKFAAVIAGATYAAKKIHTQQKLAMADKTSGEPHRMPELIDYTQPDLIQQIRAEEFIGKLDGAPFEKAIKYDFKLKTRQEHLKELMKPDAQFDLLIVGGGASGAGVVLEAASRGLNCALIDKFDFASGTSSRSTKLAHGGIRYFEQMMYL
jgi:hypothetical protein